MKKTLRLNKPRDASQSVQSSIERQPINAPQIGITPRARGPRQRDVRISQKPVRTASGDKTRVSVGEPEQS
ncbi:MAG: hypothetical protein ACFCBW_14275 [Candidatus Competibacterales bacterium]